ncbi:MAG: DUF6051 family protein, partial [Deltaproteobacteria bacterium]|nr:DUF6051 family protein [Deltaproteobacteria bacterium]
MPECTNLADLRRDISLDLDQIDLGHDLYARNFTFVSQSHDLLTKSDSSLGDLKTGPTASDPAFNSLYHLPDEAISENRVFRYHVILPQGVSRAESLIILIHGFNERTWGKYLPWAAHLVKKTGQGVLL